MSRKLKSTSQINESTKLEELPNIGKSLANDLRKIGIYEVKQLKKSDGFNLYKLLCKKIGKRIDPCCLDTFIAVVDFVNGAAAKPWWKYTAKRKIDFPSI